ncbi:hypothetical protein [Gallaecimonas sp. GXIMD4217]|uniref:hypothetical protein n=1 Tax=Gallaecimonas sp. GXIMD4217 TaxID=3131927 RepID=UPI00311AF147
MKIVNKGRQRFELCQGSLVARLFLKVVGLFLAALVAGFGWFMLEGRHGGLGLGERAAQVLSWSLGATLCWHLLFAARRRYFDLGNGEYLDRVGALYPIAERRIPLASIAAVSVMPKPLQSRSWQLVLVVGQDNLVLEYGLDPERLATLGRELAALIDRPLVRESSV